MVLSLLFGKKYARTDIAGVVIDAVISEDHIYNSRVTSYPVEDGKIISDHIINEPETLQISGMVSDTPLSFITPFSNPFSVANSPSVNAFQRLVEIHNRRELITVITGIKVYENMAITALQVPRNLQSGQSLTFTMDFQKVVTDSSVRFTENPNNPFDREADKIPREIVGDADRYPFHQQNASTTFKDQASSSVDAGIQDLRRIPPGVSVRIISLAGAVGRVF